MQGVRNCSCDIASVNSITSINDLHWFVWFTERSRAGRGWKSCENRRQNWRRKRRRRLAYVINVCGCVWNRLYSTCAWCFPIKTFWLSHMAWLLNKLFLFNCHCFQQRLPFLNKDQLILVSCCNFTDSLQFYLQLCHYIGAQWANCSSKGPTAGVESQDRPWGQLREEGKASECGGSAETPYPGCPGNGGRGQYTQAKNWGGKESEWEHWGVPEDTLWGKRLLPAALLVVMPLDTPELRSWMDKWITGWLHMNRTLKWRQVTSKRLRSVSWIACGGSQI